MGDLSDFDGCVEEFMEDFGGPATVVIRGPQKKDPVTGDLIYTTTDYPVKAILLDIMKTLSGVGTVSATTIQNGDKVCFIQPPEKVGNPALPKLDPAKDTVIMGGITYKVVTVKETNPSTDNLVMLEVYLRR